MSAAADPCAPAAVPEADGGPETAQRDPTATVIARRPMRPLTTMMVERGDLAAGEWLGVDRRPARLRQPLTPGGRLPTMPREVDVDTPCRTKGPGPGTSPRTGRNLRPTVAPSLRSASVDQTTSLRSLRLGIGSRRLISLASRRYVGHRQSIAALPNRLDQPILSTLVEFSSKAPDVHLDDVGPHVPLGSPEGRHDLGLREHLARVPGQ